MMSPSPGAEEWIKLPSMTPAGGGAMPQVTEALNEIDYRVNAGASFDEVLDRAFALLRSLIPVERMSVALLEEGSSILRSVWVQSVVPPVHLPRSYRAPVLSGSLKVLFETHQPRIINDLPAYFALHPDSAHTKLAIQDGIRSSLALPLVCGSKAIGAIFFSSFQTQAYQDFHLPIFSLITNHLTLIVERARLKKFFEENRSNDRMLAMVVHDLRNPIGIIQGFLDLIPKEDWYQRLTTNDRSVFAALRRNSDALLALIQDLAELRELTSENTPLQLTDCDVRRSLSEFDEDAVVLAAKKKIGFISSFDRHLPQFAAIDVHQLRQVLQNLLSNAIKFSYSGSTIEFTVGVVENRLEIAMQDHGQGIAANEVDRLFQWMGRTSTRPTAGESSTGLGLSICKRIVEAHGGEIGVETILDVGSRFWFWIPLRHRAPATE